MAHHGNGARIGPVQIVKHQYHRCARRQREEKLAHGIEHADAFLVGLQRDRLRDVGQALAQHRHQMRQRGGTEAEVGAQRLRRGAARVIRQRLHERTVRPRGLPLVAAPPQHQRPLATRRIGKLLHQARLPDAGLADQHHQPAAPTARLLQALPEAGQLRRPPDERRAGQQG
jgi:hypothetical protein